MTVIISNPFSAAHLGPQKAMLALDALTFKKDYVGLRTGSGLSTASAAAILAPADRAAFAVTSRLLASIVTENLLRAFYVPVDAEHAAGVCVILSTHVIGECSVLERSLRPSDVFAVIPLHHAPVFKGENSVHGRPVWLLDPLDMLPSVYELRDRQPSDPLNVGHISSTTTMTLTNFVS